jgi:hypothetical protein
MTDGAISKTIKKKFIHGVNNSRKDRTMKLKATKADPPQIFWKGKIMAKYKHIYFEIDSDGTIECRTTKGDHLLGEVSYYPRWKMHEFVPELGTAYTWDCCRDISAYLKKLDDERTGQ